jgi:predicted nucleotidyltransferase
MDLSHPEYTVLGENRARVLSRLSLLVDPMSGRRIHELSGVRSLRTTQQILADLAEIGLVEVRRVGSANAYSVNRQHVLWPLIEQVLAVRSLTETRIAAILDEALGDHVTATAVFGSYARGDAGRQSDIDIVVVVETIEAADGLVAALDDVAESIRQLTGNEAQLLPLARQELSALIARDDPLVASLRRDARPLTGVPITTLLEGSKT